MKHVKRFFIRLALIVVALVLLSGVGLYFLSGSSTEAVKIGEISTTWRLFGSNDSVAINRYDDPKVDGVSCYVSIAKTGGITGSFGLAEDPSRFSIACRAIGPVKFLDESAKSSSGESVFSERSSVLFKTITITRHYDKEKNVLVYTATSTKLINGSPFNAISVVPLYGLI